MIVKKMKKKIKNSGERNEIKNGEHLRLEGVV